MFACLGGAAELVDVVDLAIRVARQVGTKVQHQDDVQARLRRVFHSGDEGIDDFGRGEILVLDVDVALGIGDGAFVGFEDAGFTVG